MQTDRLTDFFINCIQHSGVWINCASIPVSLSMNCKIIWGAVSRKLLCVSGCQYQIMWVRWVLSKPPLEFTVFFSGLHLTAPPQNFGCCGVFTMCLIQTCGCTGTSILKILPVLHDWLNLELDIITAPLSLETKCGFGEFLIKLEVCTLSNFA